MFARISSVRSVFLDQTKIRCGLLNPQPPTRKLKLRECAYRWRQRAAIAYDESESTHFTVESLSPLSVIY
jgi:hypothetical protein